MNIAIFADNFYPQINGVVTAIANLSDGLAKRGHRVLVIAPKYRKATLPKLHPNIELITVRSIPSLFYHDIKFTNIINRKIYKALKKNKIEILHFHAPLTLAFQAIMFAKLMKLPLVGTFHTFFAESDYLKHAKLDYKFVQKLSWKYNNMYYNRCNLVTSPSESTRKILMGHRYRKPIKVISNGINPKIFDNSGASAIKNKYNPDGPICLFVGRIAHEKNIEFLIRAFDRVVKKISNAKLLIVGWGPQFKDIQATVKELKLENQVLLLGAIPHDELIASGIYGASDLFVTASKTENQSVTLLEAQINGLPCVVADAKGNPDLVTNNKNGLLIKPNSLEEFSEGMIKLLQNPKLLQKFRGETLEMIKKHHIERVIDEWEKTYHKLIKENLKNRKKTAKKR